MTITICIGVLIAIMVFLAYSALAINHAGKFRHLSKRTAKLTWIYIITSSILLTLIIVGTLVIHIK